MQQAPVHFAAMAGRREFDDDYAVSVDTSEYVLAPPGIASKSPGVILAVTEGPRVCYQVRVRLPLGTMMDLTVPAEKVEAA
jgi:hypothetical protein